MAWYPLVPFYEIFHYSFFFFFLILESVDTSHTFTISTTYNTLPNHNKVFTGTYKLYPHTNSCVSYDLPTEFYIDLEIKERIK